MREMWDPRTNLLRKLLLIHPFFEFPDRVWIGWSFDRRGFGPNNGRQEEKECPHLILYR